MGIRNGIRLARLAKGPSAAKKWWIISVAGYGSFAYRGDEYAAEKIRAHKANWEGGVGTKRPANTKRAEDRSLITDERNLNRSGIYRP